MINLLSNLLYYSVIGLVVVVLGSGSETAQDSFNSELLGQGIMWALLGSFCYALYLVVFRKTVGSENNIDVPMFFGKFANILNLLNSAEVLSFRSGDSYIWSWVEMLRGPQR